MNDIKMAKAKATAALQALRPRIAGRPFYAWAGYWHPGGWTELVWAGEGWAEICTAPKSAKMTPELRLTVVIEGTGEYVCQGELIEEGPGAVTPRPENTETVRGQASIPSVIHR